jgi:effector-binding domain-containing protein
MRAMEIEVIDVAPMRLAGVTRRVGWNALGEAIGGALDVVWPVLRAAGMKTGHNVVVYRDTRPHAVTLDIGVQIEGELAPTGEVAVILVEGGRAAHAIHRGPYAELGKTHDALTAYCNEHRFEPGEHWEIYDDPSEDVTQLRTDVYRRIGTP